MPVRCSLVILFTLLLMFSSSLALVSTAEASRTKAKASAGKKRKKVSLLTVSRSPLQLDEHYLRSEFDAEDNSVLQRAVTLLGARYRFGGESDSGIDCSAFVRKVYGFLNESLPRTAREQYAMGKEVPPEELQKGDLLFFHTYARFPSHVGIYVGDDLMIHASSRGGRVTISRFDTPYFRSRFIGARRIPSEGGVLSEIVGDGETKTKTAGALL